MGNRLDQKPFNQVKTKNSLEAERILVGGYKVSINFQVFHDNSEFHYNYESKPKVFHDIKYCF